VQFLFAFKQRLEQAFPELARVIVDECGKTLAEAEGELRRGIENVEVACGIPSLMMGAMSEDIASGIDELLLRQPLGVVAVITPFNFPGMIPLWFLPYAIACGNTVVLKPSEKTPVTMARMCGMLDDIGLPDGVVNLVHGQRETVEAILDHPDVRAVSFVGSSPVARYVYHRAAASGKRVQCQGGAVNPLVILPDADMEATTKIVADSAFGCAGQRCLAGSWAVTVGDAHRSFTERIADAAASRRVGPGADPGVQMGPVISADSRERIRGLVEDGITRGARAIVDGHRAAFSGSDGYFLRPSVVDDVPLDSPLAETEVFGPVLRLRHVATLDDAIAFVNRGAFGNMACLFTTSGNAARQFRYDVQAGNIGINVGVAAPMACFPFSGWKDSFFGDLHAQGRDAIEFYTDKKVVIERWSLR
jgi:malonate-semialdehyde dehydrogenase (acetylating)/methylmalonate-semialdehyde dehydrogenase